MAIIQYAVPSDFVFSKDQILYRVASTRYVETVYTQSFLALKFPNDPPAPLEDEGFTFTFNGQSITFTFKDTPANDYELPTNTGTLNQSDYVDLIILELKKYYLIYTYFDINAGPPYIYINVKYGDYYADLNALDNCSNTEFSAAVNLTDDWKFRDIKIGLQVYVQNDDPDTNYTRIDSDIKECELYDDSGDWVGVALFDVAALLHSYLKSWVNINSEGPYLDTAKKFYVFAYEIVDGKPATGVEIIDYKHVQKGGGGKLLQALAGGGYYSGFTDYVDNVKWLTNRLHRTVAMDCYDFLNVYFKEEHTELALLADFFYADGTSTTEVILDLYSNTETKAHRYKVGPGNQALVFANIIGGGDTCLYYEVYLADSYAGPYTVISNKARFYPTDKVWGSKQIYYENSFGVLEGLMINGEWQNEISATKNAVVKTWPLGDFTTKDGIVDVFNAETERSGSGVIVFASQKEALAIEEIVNSDMVLFKDEDNQDAVIRVKIKGGKFIQKRKNDYGYSFEIEWKRTYLEPEQAIV